MKSLVELLIYDTYVCNASITVSSAGLARSLVVATVSRVFHAAV